jgi:tRNA U54 and U55 pseudouridine synthase Pus10
MNHDKVTRIHRSATRDVYSLQVECADSVDADRFFGAIESLENSEITAENLQLVIDALIANRASVSVRHLLRRQDDDAAAQFNPAQDQRWSLSGPAA